MANPPTFKSLTLREWRQFNAIDLYLHPRLTVITGANGAGKSTILNIFSRHFGWNRPYLSTPYIDKYGRISYFSGLFRWVRDALGQPENKEQQVGTLAYSNGAQSVLNVPPKVGSSYHLNVSGQVDVAGVHIPSHRVLSQYQPVTNIPTAVIRPDHAFNTYMSEVRSRHDGGGSGSGPLYRLKEALISMATFGAGNAYVQPNPDMLKVYLDFIEILRQILPPSIGFVDVSIRTPDVILRTRSGEWPIDAASGGVMALIDIAWQIFMYAYDKEEFVVTIDEPENHLHPSMQRSLMSSLLAAFPRAQFIVATHSPFIVSSEKDAEVYVLKFEEAASKDKGEDRSSVSSIRLDTINRAGTASEILRDVLGVPATVPIWVEKALAEVVEEYRARPITNETLSALRNDLADLGYGELYAQALAELMRGK